MKIYKSNSDKKLSSLERGKVRLHVNNEDVEGIWVAKDPENNKMYLLNHALGFYPIPSWGSEWELGSEINIAKVRGENFDETVLTFHKEAYEHLENYITNNIFDYETYFKDHDMLEEDNL